MRQKPGLAKYQLAHCLQVIECRTIAESTKSLTHFGEGQLRFVPQTEQSLCTPQLFSSASNLENFLGTHGMGAGLIGIAVNLVFATAERRLFGWHFALTATTGGEE